MRDSWIRCSRIWQRLQKNKKKLSIGPDYPQKYRFVGAADFRGKENKLFMFTAKEGTDKVYSDVKLSYFNNSKENIIPSKKKDDDDEKKEPLQARSVGPQFVLSFHVDSVEDMRCYLYINGQCARFFPPDIKMVLPRFFEESDENKAFVDGPEIDRIIMDCKGKIRDDKFKAFLDENKVKCAWEEEYKLKNKK